MRTERSDGIGERLIASLRSALQIVSPSTSQAHARGVQQKLPLIEQVVARAGREPPLTD